MSAKTSNWLLRLCSSPLRCFNASPHICFINTQTEKRDAMIQLKEGRLEGTGLQSRTFIS